MYAFRLTKTGFYNFISDTKISVPFLDKINTFNLSKLIIGTSNPEDRLFIINNIIPNYFHLKTYDFMKLLHIVKQSDDPEIKSFDNMFHSMRTYFFSNYYFDFNINLNQNSKIGNCSVVDVSLIVDVRPLFFKDSYEILSASIPLNYVKNYNSNYFEIVMVEKTIINKILKMEIV